MSPMNSEPNNHSSHTHEAVNQAINRYMDERYDLKIRREQYRHDWKITIFSVISGAIGGLITSLIFWFVTK